MKKESDDALDKNTKLMSQSTPTTVVEIKKLISYVELAFKYCVDKYITGPLVETMELFRLTRIVNPNFAKTCSQDDTNSMIDGLFQKVPYLNNYSNKER